MRISKKVATASVASAFVLGATLVLPSMAGAQTTTTSESTTTTSSTIPETTTTTVLEPVVTNLSTTLRCVSDPDLSSVAGPLDIPFEVSIESLVTGEVGDVIPFTGSWTITLPPGLVTLATTAMLDSIGVSDFALTAAVSGGLSGGPFSASPTSFDLPVAAPSNYTGTIEGSVTVTEAGGGTLNIVNPFTMTVNVVVPNVPVPPLATTCNADNTLLLTINDGGGGPPDPTTTTTGGGSTTTTKGTTTPGSTPRFTG